MSIDDKLFSLFSPKLCCSISFQHHLHTAVSSASLSLIKSGRLGERISPVVPDHFTERNVHKVNGYSWSCCWEAEVTVTAVIHAVKSSFCLHNMVKKLWRG